MKSRCRGGVNIISSSGSERATRQAATKNPARKKKSANAADKKQRSADQSGNLAGTSMPVMQLSYQLCEGILVHACEAAQTLAPCPGPWDGWTATGAHRRCSA